MGIALRPSASRFAVPLALAAAASVVVGACGTTPTAKGATTSSVLASAKAAIAKETGAHVSVTVKSSASSSAEKITGDSGVNDGTETIALGSTTAMIKVTPSYSYISGSSSGLTSVFGLTAAQARKVGKHWVSLKAGTTQYANLQAGVTMSSVDSLLPKVAGTKMSTEELNGTKVYVLSWTSAATSSTPQTSNTLAVAAVGAALPIKEITTASGGAEESLALSEWGEHITVSAPAADSTISYTELTG